MERKDQNEKTETKRENREELLNHRKTERERRAERALVRLAKHYGLAETQADLDAAFYGER